MFLDLIEKSSHLLDPCRIESDEFKERGGSGLPRRSTLGRNIYSKQVVAKPTGSNKGTGRQCHLRDPSVVIDDYDFEPLAYRLTECVIEPLSSNNADTSCKISDDQNSATFSV
ncbi:hypothetical protein AGR1A_Lc110069 [Agrobacterium fabacearum CFBP 5771]|nr:hypothetical protein AGR1A_Lc110069 [Agrobacterium fabacearum CFBP 5771]